MFQNNEVSIVRRVLSHHLVGAGNDRTDGHPPTSATEVGPVDLTRLRDVLENHRVGPLFHHAIRQFPSAPAGLRTVAKSLFTEQLGRTLRAAADIGPIAEALTSGGVRWTVIKGPAAAATMYDRPETREWHDLDVLVHGADLALAVSVLGELGARPADPAWRGIAARRQGEAGFWLPRGTFLDLHWHPLNIVERRHTFTVDAVEMLETARSADILGRRLPILDNLHQAHHLALHATLSGGWRLAWIYDIAVIVHQTTDWEPLVALARRSGTKLAMALALTRACTVFGTQVPGAVLTELRRGGRRWADVAAGLTRVSPVPVRPTVRRMTRRFYASTGPSTGVSLRLLKQVNHEEIPLGSPATEQVALHAWTAMASRIPRVGS